MKAIYTIFLLILLMPFAMAEGPDKTSQKKNVEFSKKNFTKNPQSLDYALSELKMGDQFYEIGNWMYVDALFHYQNAYTVNPDNALLNYKIGKSYLMTFNKEQSLSYLEDAYLIDPQVSPDIALLLAESYQINYRFDKAIEMYNIFLTARNRNVEPADIKTAELKLMQTYNAIDLFTHPKPFVVSSTGGGINSLYPEYCPVISSDGSSMYYTSRRPGTTGGNRDERDYKYNEDIYKATKVNGLWKMDQSQPVEFNSDTHDATVGLSADGKTMLVYRGTNGGDLFVSQLTDWDQWSSLQALTDINTQYKESSAAISPDGQRLYFTSDRPGGYGGLDIYTCVLQADGSLGKPINLGPTINSAYDEEGVSLNAEGNVLFFSSNGLKSMGGYDVFKSRNDGTGWSAPENLGYPLNTPEDDVFYTFTGDENFAFFSSERVDGFGSQDIYTMQMIPQRNPMIVLSGLVIDKLSGIPVENSDVFIMDENGKEIGTWNDIGMGTPMYSVEVESGKTYRISARAEGYNASEEILTIENNESEFDNVMHVTELSMLDISRLNLPNIFFDFDKYDLRQAAINDLNYVVKIMNEYPEINLELSGHTDIVGAWDYNLALSHKRAQTVLNYLISKGVSAERLSISWHSFDMPWGDNSNDTGRQFNRRTEIKIISHNK